MEEEKSLLKFTSFEAKKEYLFSLDTIDENHLTTLSKEEYDLFVIELINQIGNTEGNSRDEYLKKIDLIIPKDVKNQLWENNHFIITSTISDLILENGRMPTKNEISTKSKISRQTVHKHLKEYPNNPLYIEQLEVLKIMSNQIIAKVYQLAIAGDVGASKLFLNVAGSLMGNIEDSKRKIVVTIKKMEENEIKNQSNFIQINNTFLNQESVSKLNENQILEIERILKGGIN